MRIEVLTVPECPNGPLVEERLAEALAGRPDVTVERRVAATAAQAGEYGMHGSPTVLIDGRDPFAAPGDGTSLSCRLYRDEHGQVAAAYPCSARPTGIEVALPSGVMVASMGAIDALSIAAMLGSDTVIDSADPVSGERVRVTFAGGIAQWHPEGTVVFYGARAGSGPSAAVCCGYLRFFAVSENAEVFAARHPEAPGRILGQQEARALGEEIFGPLLAPDT